MKKILLPLDLISKKTYVQTVQSNKNTHIYFCENFIKKIILVLILVLVTSEAQAGGLSDLTKGYDFYFFGVNTETFKAKNLNYWAAGAGALTAVAAHMGGHYLMASIHGVSIKQDGLREIYDFSKMNDRQAREISAGGAGAQAFLGLLLTSIPFTRQTSFTKGYVIAETLETFPHSYIWRGEKDDTKMSTNHGGSNWEMVGYDLIAVHNILRINWKKE